MDRGERNRLNPLQKAGCCLGKTRAQVGKVLLVLFSEYAIRFHRLELTEAALVKLLLRETIQKSIVAEQFRLGRQLSWDWKERLSAQPVSGKNSNSSRPATSASSRSIAETSRSLTA